MLVHMRVNICVCVFDVFMSLVWPPSVPQALFFGKKKAFPDFLTMSIPEIAKIVRLLVFMDFGTCLKRRASKNHAFWRY